MLTGLRGLLKKIDRYTVTSALFLGLIFYLFVFMLINHSTIFTKIQNAYEYRSGLGNTTMLGYVRSFIKATDNGINTAVEGRKDFITLNGLVQRLTDQSVVEESSAETTVYRLTNGQLTYQYPLRDLRNAHKNMHKLRDLCTDLSINLFYVQLPYKVNRYDNKLPYDLIDYPNQNADNFLTGLTTLEIPYLDLRENIEKELIQEQGMSYESLFFDTDHHWTTQTAFWGYQELLSYMQETFAFEYNKEYANPENFNLITMEDSFIGSLANRTGVLYAGIDDFSYYYPKFETNYRVDRYVQNYKSWITPRTGAFEATLVYEARLVTPEIPMVYRDNVYFNGNPARCLIRNDNNPDGKSALIIMDSFSKPLASFLSLQLYKTDCLDLRDYTQRTVSELIEMNQELYDYVIILYNCSAFKVSTAEQFTYFD